MSIGVCLVGLGRAGRFHFQSLLEIENLKLVSVIDPGPIDLPTSQKVTLDQALADPEIDAAIIAAPTPFHFEYIIRFLEAGKHVFSEKPLGHSIEEIDQCYKLAEQNQRILHLGFQRRCDHHFRALKKKLPQIGSIRLVKASSRDNPRPSIEYLKTSKNIFHDMLIHDFDMAIFLLGIEPPELVYAAGTVYDPEIQELGDYDTVMVTIKYPSGLIYNVDSSRISAYGYDQRLEVFGETGMVTVDNPKEDVVKLHTSSGTLEAPAEYTFSQRYRDAYRRELEVFTQAILEDGGPNVTREECLLSHLIADAAAESAKHKRVVDFPLFYSDRMITLSQ